MGSLFEVQVTETLTETRLKTYGRGREAVFSGQIPGQGMPVTQAPFLCHFSDSAWRDNLLPNRARDLCVVQRAALPAPTDRERSQWYCQLYVSYRGSRYDLISAPVVDKYGHVQGRLTVETVMNYIRKQAEGQALASVSAEFDSGRGSELAVDTCSTLKRKRPPGWAASGDRKRSITG
jgi:hypothetical protein